jgi:hypothetical protein
MFGVITDFPISYRLGDKWMLNINVIDPSLNQKATNEIEAQYQALDKYGKSRANNFD